MNLLFFPPAGAQAESIRTDSPKSASLIYEQRETKRHGERQSSRECCSHCCRPFQHSMPLNLPNEYTTCGNVHDSRVPPPTHSDNKGSVGRQCVPVNPLLVLRLYGTGDHVHGQYRADCNPLLMLLDRVRTKGHAIAGLVRASIGVCIALSRGHG